MTLQLHHRSRLGAPATLLLVALPVLLSGCAPAGNGDEGPGGGETATPARSGGATAESRSTGETGTPRPAAGTAWVVFGADTVVAEVARTEEERADGLMYREELGEDRGMLFIFPDNVARSFWMQNTYIPLDIAFMDPSFRIVDIQQMEPMTTDAHMSRGPAMYALEVNQGWFQAHGVQVGATARVTFGN